VLSGFSLHFAPLDVDLGLLDVERNHSVHLRDHIWLVGVLRYLSLTAFLVDPHIALVRLIHLLRELNLASRMGVVHVILGQFFVAVAVFSLLQVGLAGVIPKRPRVEVISCFGQ